LGTDLGYRAGYRAGYSHSPSGWQWRLCGACFPPVPATARRIEGAISQAPDLVNVCPLLGSPTVTVRLGGRPGSKALNSLQKNHVLMRLPPIEAQMAMAEGLMG